MVGQTGELSQREKEILRNWITTAKERSNVRSCNRMDDHREKPTVDATDEDEFMGYRDSRYMVSFSLVDDSHIVHADLTSEECEAIGYVITQWALLEHIILMHTIELAQSANAPVPEDALNKSFDKRSKAWRRSIENHVTDVKERERLLVLYRKAKDAEDRRHKVAHGVWTWAEGTPTRLLAYSFRPEVAFEHGFDHDRLRKLGDEIGAIGFQIEYPGGKDEAWRVSSESWADQNGNVQYVSRSFLLEMKKLEMKKKDS